MIRNKNNNKKKTNYLMSMDNFMSKKTGIALIASVLMSGVATSAHAGISNTAKATGTYNGTINSATDTVEVPVTDTRKLTTAVALITGPTINVGAGKSAYTDAGDQIVYDFTVTNTGMVTEENITINNEPTFNTVAGEGTWSFTQTSTTGADLGSVTSLAPGKHVVIRGTYTFTDNDAFRSAGVTDAVSLQVRATSDEVEETVTTESILSDEVTANVVGYAELEISKDYDLDDTNGTVADKAEVGEVITYTYEVTNIGNVAVADVSIVDLHGTTTLTLNEIQGKAIGEFDDGPLGSTLGSSHDGIIQSLAAGAIASFTYAHTVTQTEVDAQ